jgi:hypothetical protein
LPAADLAATDHFAADFLGGLADNDHADRAVGQHHAVADFQVAHQFRIRASELIKGRRLAPVDEAKDGAWLAIRRVRVQRS